MLHELVHVYNVVWQVAQTSRQAGEDARRALMDAMGVDEDDEDNAGNDSDDDLFTVRDKTMEEKDVEVRTRNLPKRFLRFE